LLGVERFGIVLVLELPDFRFRQGRGCARGVGPGVLAELRRPSARRPGRFAFLNRRAAEMAGQTQLLHRKSQPAKAAAAHSCPAVAGARRVLDSLRGIMELTRPRTQGASDASVARRERFQAGFNIIEVSIATLIIGVLVASILTTITHGFGILSRSRETLRGNQILQQELETIRTYSWTQMTNSANFGSTNIADGGVVYSVAKYVAPYTNSTIYGTNNIRKVTVTIVWTNMNGDQMSKSMTTLVSQGGLNDYIY
jgi:prepilin-type N-terminal cleavage/methylation domain-containing protein